MTKLPRRTMSMAKRGIGATVGASHRKTADADADETHETGTDADETHETGTDADDTPGVVISDHQFILGAFMAVIALCVLLVMGHCTYDGAYDADRPMLPQGYRETVGLATPYTDAITLP